MKRIPTFVINLKFRIDRREHIIKEFSGRGEFDLTIVDAHTHEYGAIGLWNTIKHIIHDLTLPADEFVLICEDDHLFTETYSSDILYSAIEDADKMQASVLSGGVSWHEDAVPISDTLFWVKHFSGTQFIIIFRRFFKDLLDADFSECDCADGKIGSLSDKIFFMYPFISIQKEFGYSDVTLKNHGTHRVQSLFEWSSTGAKNSSNVGAFFNKIGRSAESRSQEIFDNETNISTFIINLSERVDRRDHILDQFKDKPEFDVTLVEA